MSEAPKWQLIAGLIIGVFFSTVIMVLAVLIPAPTQTTFFIFRGVFAISLAAIAAIIPGLISVESVSEKLSIRAYGSIAVFVIIWIINPPALVGQ